MTIILFSKLSLVGIFPRYPVDMVIPSGGMSNNIPKCGIDKGLLCVAELAVAGDNL